MRYMAFVFSVLLVAAPAVAQQDAQPSLVETMEWLKGKMKQFVIYYDDSADGLTTYSDRSEFIDAKDCRMAIFTGNASNTIFRGKKILSLVIKNVYVIPLGSLTPSGIRVTEALPSPGQQRSGTVFVLKATTYGSRDEIYDEMTTIIDEKESAPKKLNVSSFTVRFSDHEVAERVAKALAHVSSLCGAKTEPF
jgi:hypothetical protein